MNIRQNIFSFTVGMSLVLIGLQFSTLIPAVSAMLWLGVALVATTSISLMLQKLQPAYVRKR
jgi:hypothetical protein